MSEYRAVCFDMDGVLVDSEPLWNRVWQEIVFPEVESGEPSLEDVTGRSYTETVPELDETYGLERDPQHYIDRIDERAPELYATEADGATEVHALFEELRERGLAVGIVSSSPMSWIDRVRERFDIGELDVVQSAMEIDGPGKPAPDVYETAAARLGVPPEDCIVVEDSVSGAEAAAAAGMTVIRFAIGENPESVPAAAAVAGDPTELRAILFDLLGEA